MWNQDPYAPRQPEQSGWQPPQMQQQQQGSDPSSLLAALQSIAPFIGQGQPPQQDQGSGSHPVTNQLLGSLLGG